MIHLLSVPRLGQAGVKRLHPTLSRIRLRKYCLGSCALLNRSEFTLCLVFTAPHFSKSRQLHNRGLKLKPMHHRGKRHLYPLIADQRVKCAFSAPESAPQSLSPDRRLFRDISERNTERVAVSTSAALAAEFLQKTLVSTLALHELCFSRVARQLQQPAVEALTKV